MLILNLAELGTILTTLPICPPYNLRICHNIIITTKNTLHYCTAINQHASTLQQNTYAHTYHKLIKNRTRRISHFPTSPTGISTWHSWIITAHVSLGNLEHHWKTFNRQFDRTQQLLLSLDQHPSAPTQLLSTFQLELSNIKDIYNSGKTTITSAIILYNPTNHRHTSATKGAYYPSLEMLSVGLLGQPLQNTYTALKQG